MLVIYLEVVEYKSMGENNQQWLIDFYLLEPGKFLVDATNKCLRNILEKVVKRTKNKFDDGKFI